MGLLCLEPKNQMTTNETDGEGTDRHWPDPTPEQLKSPLFEAIWQTIKRWDINVPSAYAGYCGATGNHVRAILDAIEPYGERCRAEERTKGEKLAEVLEHAVSLANSYGENPMPESTCLIACEAQEALKDWRDGLK